MSTTAVKLCDCEHTYQDKEYGKKRRLMNQVGKKPPFKYRCTVCTRIH